MPPLRVFFFSWGELNLKTSDLTLRLKSRCLHESFPDDRSQDFSFNFYIRLLSFGVLQLLNLLSDLLLRIKVKVPLHVDCEILIRFPLSISTPKASEQHPCRSTALYNPADVHVQSSQIVATSFALRTPLARATSSHQIRSTLSRLGCS